MSSVVKCYRLLDEAPGNFFRVPSCEIQVIVLHPWCMYSCSWDSLQTSAKELLFTNSFELIFIYSCSICTPRSSCGCFILWTSVRHVVAVKGGRQPGKETSLCGCGAALLAVTFLEFLKTEQAPHLHAGCHSHASSLQGLTLFCLMLSPLMLKVVLETEGPQVATERD